MYIGVKVIFHAEFPKEYRPPAILIGSVGALFFLGFFSLHFCGFHAVHAIFLSSFFPIEVYPVTLLPTRSRTQFCCGR